MISHLLTEGFKVELGGKEYKLQPYNLEVMCRIAKHFEVQGKDGLNYVRDVMAGGLGSSEYIATLIDTIYFLIENPDLSVEEFRKDILAREKKVEKLNDVLIRSMNDSKPIYEHDGDQSKKKVLGATLIILSIIGLFSLTSWLVDMAGHLPSFLNLLKSKFN